MTGLSGLPGPDPRAGVFGPGALAELPGLVGSLVGPAAPSAVKGGAAAEPTVLLLTGRASFTASGAAAVLPALRRVATVETWSDFSPNPKVDDLVAGARVLRELQPDAIVAIGGGSVLDMAKLLSVLGDLDPEAITEAVRANTVPPRSRPLVLAPTTSGSGAEATHFAVAYLGADKHSVADRSMLPDAVVLDPDLTASAERHQKATSVIDAVAQAVESHWARGATTASREFAAAALRELVPSAIGFLAGDAEATRRAAHGSHLAGRAIDLSKTTGAHALSYGFTTRHRIPHGHAVALTLGGFARLHATAADGDLAGDLEAIAAPLDVDGPEQIGAELDRLAGDLGLELRLGALGVPRDDLATMAGTVNRERLANNPVELSESDVRQLLESRW